MLGSGDGQPIGDRHRDLWEEVYDELRRMIVLGELAAGARLVETDLAKRFKVSRGPIRTALMALARAGLISLTSRQGAVVESFTQEDVHELYSLRGALESLALNQLDKSPTPDRVKRMAEHLDRLEEAQDRGDAVTAMEADLAFHREITLLSDNRRLVDAWERLADQLRVVIAAVQRENPEVASNPSQHRPVIAAIERGDGQEAATALNRHLDDSRHVMLSMLPSAADRRDDS